MYLESLLLSKFISSIHQSHFIKFLCKQPLFNSDWNYRFQEYAAILRIYLPFFYMIDQYYIQGIYWRFYRLVCDFHRLKGSQLGAFCP